MMKKTKFTLLQKQQPGDVGDSPEGRIEQLRTIARSYIEANNKLVRQIWDLEQQIVQNNDAEMIERLTEEKNTISSLIMVEEYRTKIGELLEEIKTLEMSLKGYSDVGNNSPYRL